MGKVWLEDRIPLLGNYLYIDGIESWTELSGCSEGPRTSEVWERLCSEVGEKRRPPHRVWEEQPVW